MFNEEAGSSVGIKAGRAFVHQTSAILYALPSSDAEVVTRLAEGTPVDVVAEQGDAQAGWMCVQASGGQNGFMRTNTNLSTREQLLDKRAAILRGSRVGCGQMLIGGSICLCGVAVTIGTYLLSEKYKATNTIYILYGAVIAGGGQFMWGLEQVTNSRHTLKQFDALWQAADVV